MLSKIVVIGMIESAIDSYIEHDTEYTPNINSNNGLKFQLSAIHTCGEKIFINMEFSEEAIYNLDYTDISYILKTELISDLEMCEGSRDA